MLHMAKEDIAKMQIKRIEKEIRDTPYHKGTEHHIGRLKARLARLKDRELESKTKSSGRGRGGYGVKKQGDATVVLVGPPSAGKSTLINKLTNAKSKVAPYEFTTVSVIPGMMNYKDAFIQILDVPGLIEGAETGKGRGREVLSVARGADLVVIISDVNRPEAIERIKASLEKNGIRLNKSRPEVKIEKKTGGGIVLHSNIKQELAKETIKEVAREMGIKNAEISINEKLTFERLIDSFSGNRVYIPALMALNKADLAQKEDVFEAGYILISAEKEIGLENLREMIWEKLKFVRIYLVGKDEVPSPDNPIIMKVGDKLTDAAAKIGNEFAESKKSARIWGAGAKFEGQEVSLKIQVQEGMMVRLI
jgi:small GTP-binding protein